MNKKMLQASAETLVITSTVIALTHKRSWPVRIITAVLVNDAITFAVHPQRTIAMYKSYKYRLLNKNVKVETDIGTEYHVNIPTEQHAWKVMEHSFPDLVVEECIDEGCPMMRIDNDEILTYQALYARYSKWDGDLTKLAGWAEL